MKTFKKLFLCLLVALPIFTSANIYAQVCPNDEIWYTSTDGKVVTLTQTNVFGANIVSNTYTDGKGIIKFDGNVTSIGDWAFRYRSSLTSINIPNSVTSIGDRAFAGCSSLASITIPNSVTSIESWAFEGCSSLASITIPNSVTSIESWAFRDCSSLVSVSIGNSVTSIGSSAFDGCWKLTAVHISSLESWCKIKFENYYANPAHFAHKLYLNNEELKEVVIPNSIDTIKAYVFSNCSSFISVTIPNAVKSIEKDAFYNCSSLTSINIPNSVTSIEGYAFFGCTSLPVIDNILYADTYLIGVMNKTFSSYIIKEGTKWIGNAAFSGCSNLTSITIPNSVMSIGGSALYDCSSLTSITNLAITPQTISSTCFSNYAVTLHVYEGLKNLYSADAVWGKFTVVDDIPTKKVTSIILDKTTASMMVDDTLTLKASVLPEDATLKFCAWTSSNEEVATVDERGVVTAVSAGGVTIKATAADGSEIAATCEVTVKTKDEPDTDISKFDNIVYLTKQEGTVGGQVTYSLKMKNEVEACGFQVDLYLPEGVTIAVDDDDFPRVELSNERTSSKKTDFFSTAVQKDGTLRILCSSTKGYAFEGNDGEVAKFVVNIADDMEEGNYPVILRKIEISDLTSQCYRVDYFKSTLEIFNYTLGDVNADGDVTVSDFTAVANHILGNTPSTFIAKAADVNVDGFISVGDLTGVANIILYGQPTGPTSIKRRNADDQSSVAVYANIPNFTLSASNSIILPFNIQNIGMQFSAYQFDIVLPEGVQLVDVNMNTERLQGKSQDFFAWHKVGENTYRVLCASTLGTSFEGNNGSVAMLTLAAEKNLSAGVYELGIQNVEISENAISAKADDTTVRFIIGNETSIDDVDVDTNSNANVIYNLAGQKLQKPQKGINIVNGKKVLY